MTFYRVTTWAEIFFILAGMCMVSHGADAPASASPPVVEEAPTESAAAVKVNPDSLLINGDFSQWDGDKPAAWNPFSGITIQKSAESWQNKPVIECTATKKTKMEQILVDLPGFVQVGDLVHMSLWMKCSEENIFRFSLGFANMVSDRLEYADISKNCPGDGAWHLVELEWVVSSEQVAEKAKLKNIYCTIHLLGAPQKPVYFSGAGAWLASVGL